MQEFNDSNSRFGFHLTPFTCEIRVNEHFVNESYTEPLEYLQSAVDKRMSAALIAPAGMGKTTLLRALVSHLSETRYQTHYVKVTDLSKRDLCREISVVAGIEAAGNYPTLVRRLQERFAESLDMDGLRPVLLIDEAHGIRPEVLGVLKILTNFEMDSRLVVSIVLSGQSHLATMLKNQKLEDVAKRLAYCATLRLLSRAETKSYIQHRCHIAGAANCPFDPGAIEALYEIGRGNLRATDHLALKAIELAHALDCDVVDANHVAKARTMLWN
ncbi:MAG: AAA family ATPase [Proteobacteria bacterium]|nr:AAA family ATPase [Pseudomonadota bacterium]